MQIPKRKSENRRLVPVDTFITEERFNELKLKLKRMKEVMHPKLAEESKRLAQFGDFSENAEYQIAKGKLRGLNQKISETEFQINHAQVIKASKNTDKVGLGHFVTIESQGKQKTYQILGSTESSPQAGIISRHSPLGEALLGSSVGEVVEVQLKEKKVKYKIVAIK
ncbi:MAG: Transcription elongation factor GreA [Parcubacteria group bacterium GW2011_GWC2_39_14]|nr:MAG: Transcription elongation factor GreA [Parcubacteria group bacterium GW2011_GWC2_39_14]KKR55544.1 MAG: Transcription elongation factor GreA [Parcubacteria group bacterium GW2011_GWA2_40_23]